MIFKKKPIPEQPSEARPQNKDVDVWGLTHPGKVRKTNQDHFFVGSLSRGVVVDSTSLGSGIEPAVAQDRLASFSMVADGVGGSGGGEEAARLAVQHLVQEVARNFHDARIAEATDPEVFAKLLNDATLACHQELVAKADEDPDRKRFATTLTLFLGLWPHAYLLQVGDSRCYMFRDGDLTQITRDQTVAQDLVDQGVLTQTKAHYTKWANVLSSSLGGQQAAPVVTRIVRKRGTVLMLCSDGLTTHVSDEQIKEHLANMTSARQAAEDLLQAALDGGGSDNITIVIGRTLQPPDAPEHPQPSYD
jgi:PPM family protein phosphatase